MTSGVNTGDTSDHQGTCGGIWAFGLGILTGGLATYAYSCFQALTKEEVDANAGSLPRRSVLSLPRLDGNACGGTVVPIPPKLASINPKTPEGRWQIANYLVNFSEHHHTAAYVKSVSIALANDYKNRDDKYTEDRYQEHLSLPLRRHSSEGHKHDAQHEEQLVLWNAIIPLIWETVSPNHRSPNQPH